MFAQLDTKTVYSFMDSLVTLPSYIQKAKELGYQTIGIMDKDSLYAAYHFVKMAEKADLKAVLGLELSLWYEEQYLTFYFVAKHTAGYKNLLKLSTQKMTGHESFSDFSDFLEDVAIIVPYMSEIPQLNLPKGSYIGVFPDTPRQEFSYPTIPLYTVRYYHNDDRETLQVLHAIKDNLPLKDVSAVPYDQVLYSPESMVNFFEDNFPESLVNLNQLVSDISYVFDTHLKLPRFNRKKEANVELRELAETGLQTKGLWISAYQKRLEEELQVIHQMEFDDYFLIVWDLLRFGRSRDYYMGMGRGSAAGSLVAYALKITGIDPVANGLLFERFLNVERYSMPDIDIDLPDIYRSEFLHYVRDRYGSKHTAQIVTFSTFGAKQVLRDVLKRFGASEYELSQLTKKVGFKDNLESAYEKNISFRQLINSRSEYKRAFAIAQKIEGQPRQSSIHAAGIVMSDDDLTNHIPLKQGDDMFITQYDASAVEANGLLKMDFLGLRNLTFLQKMKEELVKESEAPFEIETINLEDAETLKLFSKGETKGIFQFEQAGAIHLLKRIKPARFEEIVATTSLNRPGASDYTDNFVNRKYGKEPVDLIDPVVASILAPTYGIMLYQEQVMQIAQIYAGFTLGKADLLRRAMSKKNSEEMAKMKADFIEGAKSLNRSLTTAETLFSMMAKFAGYGFNRSHAYAYSALAFQLAYFKTHYPHIFYRVMLNYANSDYLEDALRRGFNLEKLNINMIPYEDKIDTDKITLGLHRIKAFPRELAYWILENRPFHSLEDFVMRLPKNFQKTELLTPLIQIGLFDFLDTNRHKLVENLEHLFLFINELGSLFADSSYNWLDAEDYTAIEKYQLEQDIIGVGLSPHPLKEMIANADRPFLSLDELEVNKQATILVQIENIRVIRTKTKGQQMAFLRVTDTLTSFDVTLFPEQYHQFSSRLSEGNIYYLTGRIQERDGKLQMILSELQQMSHEKFWIQVMNHENDKEIAEILSLFSGDIPVILHYPNSKELIKSQRFFVQKDEKLQLALKDLVVKTIYH